VAGKRETFATNLATVEAPPTRFMVTGERGVSLLLDRFGGARLRIVRHFRADGTLLDAAVTAAGGTKEAGLAVLCEAEGIPLAEVLAIGDAESDAGMLRAAGVGVAVEDGSPEAKAAADWIAPAAADCGVAAAIRRYLPG
jgi:hydroxymethylpyrimidine pyrophosphatase-like HAD family hydrolase